MPEERDGRALPDPGWWSRLARESVLQVDRADRRPHHVHDLGRRRDLEVLPEPSAHEVVTLSVEDRFELRELVDSYAMAVDALDVEWFSSLWTPDAVIAVHDATGEVRRWHGDEIGGM